jgi:uncharacterized protein YceH (UPF0502 family)
MSGSVPPKASISDATPDRPRSQILVDEEPAPQPLQSEIHAATSDGLRAPPKIGKMRISPEEGRVIGSLIEKQLTTPQQYPLTLNALIAACNQSSNRDPVVCYDEQILEQTLAALKTAGLVRFVHPSHGRSVIRYRQVLEERMALNEEQLALVGVLLLRGPQTAAELRGRTERMAQIDAIAAVEAELERMSVGDEPLVRRLTRRPGQKEERWVQLLAADSEDQMRSDRRSDPIEGDALGQPSGAFDQTVSGQRSSTPELPDRTGEQPTSLVDLSEQLTALRAEVVELRAALEDLQAQLGV